MAIQTHDDLRKAFLEYFEERSHRLVSSYSLIPPDDPTLLFVNAGMVQFKDVFTGMKKVDYDRATSCQKCLRVSGKHNDLENVGRTARHHTFFEMLGNFSFGDYFKRDAIKFGWEFLTEVAGLDPSTLWVSVHPEDDEAYNIWADEIGVAKDRIMHDPDNFWSMGDTGACGPCSEIYIDQGPVKPEWEDSVWGDDGDRFLEVWNLVFMQYERSLDGTLTPLPKPSIDTGMGLERILAILQGKTSNYDTDLFQPLIKVVTDATGETYTFSDNVFDLACRVLADHSRAAAFLVADGIYPSNEGRGYVLRRVLRRAIRFGRRIGMEEASVSLVADKVVDVMSGAYPELEKHRGVIVQILTQEEERFGRTLLDGEKLLGRAMQDAKSAGTSEISGKVAFTLHDTHGFPLDLTELIVREEDMTVDRDGFNEELEAQRVRSRADTSFAGDERNKGLDDLMSSGGASDFVGYDSEEASESSILAISGTDGLVDTLAPGTKAEIVLDRTPFYAESGGQVGDIGILRSEKGAVFEVEATQKYGDRLIRHIGIVNADSAALNQSDKVHAVVDHEARSQTRANHSATHLMHHALRDVLGDHVRQRGSLVGPDRLRFDFSHFGPMTTEEVEEVEKRVNEYIRENVSVNTDVCGFDEAIEKGAVAFFEEKYGDDVRVLSIGPSMELCGGTHVHRTGDIGFFAVLSEGSLSSGVRRIEARTGQGVLREMQQIRRAAQDAAQKLNTGVADMGVKLDAVLKKRKELEKALRNASAMQASESMDLVEIGKVGEVAVSALRLTDVDGKALMSIVDDTRSKIDKGALLLTNTAGGKAAVILTLTDNLTEQMHAGNTLRPVLQGLGGSGGGNAKTARGGLQNTDAATIEKLETAIVEALGNPS
jgi:alanyl-tRNA synthetase